MANVTAAYYPTVATDTASSGQAVWTTPGNITANDAAVASVSLGLSDPKVGPFVSDLLASTSYGISVPAGASILGVQIEIAGSGYVGINIVKPGATGTGKTVTLSGSNTVFNAYGGATDLWGLNGLVGSDITASSFGFNFYGINNSTQNSSSATIQAVRVTVYWDSPALPNGTIEKKYQYRVFRQGVFLGLLPNVISEFTYSQDINTAGAQISIECAVSADTSGLDAPTIDDETGTPLQTENLQTITTEKYPELIGNNASGSLFRNGNQILISEISNYHPNGIQVFSGDIERWQADYGGVGGNTIKLTCYSDGVELNNFVMTGGDSLEQSVNLSNRNADATVDKTAVGYHKAGQSFTAGAGITTLAAIGVYLTSATTSNPMFSLVVYSSPGAAVAGGTPIAEVIQTIQYVAGNTFETKFVFSPTIIVTAGQQLCFVLRGADAVVSGTFAMSTSNPYAGGDLYTANYAGGGGGALGVVTGSDLIFNSYSGGNSTVANYTATDPTNMFIDSINRYNAKGGVIKVATGTNDLTGLSLIYTFKVSRLYDGIQKMLDLAPYNWYWYVDIGSNYVYFKKTAATPKYYLTKGKHIAGLNLSASTENIKNLLYFTGGIPTGSTNLFSTYSDQASIQSNKQKLELRTDNRVTVQATADAIGNSYLNSYKNEVYQTSVNILDTTMDISLFKPGETVGFNGFGTFVDNLTLQIVRLTYNPQQVTLTLGELPPRINQTIKDLEQGLENLETLANPTTPS